MPYIYILLLGYLYETGNHSSSFASHVNYYIIIFINFTMQIFPHLKLLWSTLQHCDIGQMKSWIIL